MAGAGEAVDCCRASHSHGAGDHDRCQPEDTRRAKEDELQLGWLLLDGAGTNVLGAGLFEEARAACRDCVGMHRSHQRDSPSYIVKALRYGYFEQAVDMLNFDMARMAPSYQLAAAQAQLGVLQLLEPPGGDGDALAYLKAREGSVEGPAEGGAPAVAGGGALEGPLAPLSQAAAEALSLNHDYSVVACWDCPADDHGGACCWDADGATSFLAPPADAENARDGVGADAERALAATSIARMEPCPAPRPKPGTAALTKLRLDR